MLQVPKKTLQKKNTGSKSLSLSHPPIHSLSQSIYTHVHFPLPRSKHGIKLILSDISLSHPYFPISVPMHKKKRKKRVWLILKILSEVKTSRMTILFMTNELTRIPEEKGGGLQKGNMEWKIGFCAECASLKCSKKGILSKSMQFWGVAKKEFWARVCNSGV